VLDLDPGTAGVQGLVFDSSPNTMLGQTTRMIAASPDGTELFVSSYSENTVVPLRFVRD